MRDNNVRMIAEIGVAVALSVVLSFLTLFKMPQGGSVNLEMLPILIVAMRWGGVPGMVTGLVYGIVQLALDPYIVYPTQFILDYPLAYMLLGLAGFVPVKIKNKGNFSIYSRIFLAVLVGGTGRFVAHLLSGVIFFAQEAPKGQNPWIYSAIYNASYLIPALVISFIIIVPVLKVLLKESR